MSQQEDRQDMDMQPGMGESAQDDDFDAGFNDGAEETEGHGQEDNPDAGDDNRAGAEQGTPANTTENAGQETPPPAPAFTPVPSAPLPPVGVPPQSDPGMAATPTPAEPKPEPRKVVELPEDLKDEWEELKKLNPQAAELALEDSADGAAIRARLEQYGVGIAQDRAESILGKREAQVSAAKAEAERDRQAVEAHNQHFMGVLHRDHPEYAAMLQDPARKMEAAQTMDAIFKWIMSKPYAEAEPLMRIARNGRDPEEVSALITRYKKESGGAVKSRNPEGAYAVPGRGAASAPTSAGDMDDFDAGFDL